MVDFKKLMDDPKSVKHELFIYTARLGHTTQKIARLDFMRVIDTTNRAKHPLWAPGWDITMGHKAETVTDKEYTDKYLQRMRASYCSKTEDWLHVLQESYDQERHIVLGCYCASGAFCHRRLLADMLLKVCHHHNIPARLMGEWNQ